MSTFHITLMTLPIISMIRRIHLRSNRRIEQRINMANFEENEFFDVYNLELQLREKINDLHWKTVSFQWVCKYFGTVSQIRQRCIR